MLERSKEQDCADPALPRHRVHRGRDRPTTARRQCGTGPTIDDNDGAAAERGAGGQILGGVLGLCCAHRVLLEAFAAVVAAIGVLEGLGRSLSPDLDILTEARPIILGAVLNKGLGLGRDRRRRARASSKAKRLLVKQKQTWTTRAMAAAVAAYLRNS